MLSSIKNSLTTITTGVTGSVKSTATGILTNTTATLKDSFTNAANNVLDKELINIPGAGSITVGSLIGAEGGIQTLAAGGLSGIASNIGKAIPAKLNAMLSSQFASAEAAPYTYPKTLTNVALNPAHINFQFYSRTGYDQFSLAESINLPMPEAVSNPSTINWSQEDFGMIGNAVVTGLQKMGQGNSSGDAIQGSLSSMSDRILSVGAFNVASAAVGYAGGSASADGIMGQVAGKIPNPYKAMLFRGVNFREFSFVFKFVPFTESDCDLIDSIIQVMRSHAYPDFAGDQMFFTYPGECQITYCWESGANKWLNNFKRAVCTGIDVNYATGGQWTNMRNGFPNMITITTRWSEVEVVTKNDIKVKDKKGQRS